MRKGGRIVFVGAGTSGRLLWSRLRCRRRSARRGSRARHHGGGKNAFLRAKEGVEDNTKKAPIDHAPPPRQERRGDRRVGERHDSPCAGR
jgi:N-acetylmuramic acid 6-phosphate (MurNAc-6-P) etherase